MRYFQRVFSVVACLATAALAHAQSQTRVFVLPGAQSGSGTASIYTPDPILITNLQVQAGAYLALAKPDGTKFYVISSGSGSQITAFNNSGAIVSTLPSLTSVGVTAATLTPDGRRLVAGFANGTIAIYDTSNDTLLTQTALVLSGAPVDMAASFDSSRVFVLGPSPSGGSRITVLDPIGATQTGAVDFGGTARGLTVAPNGLLYVAAPNILLEYDIRTGTPVQLSTVGLIGDPLKPVFTPDGRFLTVANRTVAPGQASLFSVDLLAANRQVNYISGFVGATVAQILPVGNSRVLAYSNSNQTIYDVQLNPTAVSILQVPDSNKTTSAAVTNELPIPSRSSPQFIYYTTQNYLYRADLSSLALVSAPNPVGGGLVNVAIPANAATSAFYISKYNDNQTVAVGGQVLPLVVRLSDANGRPVAGVSVSFTTNGGTLQSTAAVTNSDGYAQTILANPATGGQIAITASAPGVASVIFAVNVGGGGSNPGTGAGITIVQGQGQLVSAINQAGSPLVVQLTDASGVPQPNQTVNYAVSAGSGSLSAPGVFVGGGGTVAVTTDTNGLATVNFIANAGAVPFGQAFAQTTVTASAPTGATVTFYLTIFPTTGFNGQPVPAPIVQPDPKNNPPYSTFTVKAGSISPGLLKFTVISYLGQPIPGVGVRIVNTSDNAKPAAAACNGGTPLSDQTGVVSCDLKALGLLGSNQITARVGEGIDFVYTLNITPGDPGGIKILGGNNQSGSPGQTLPQALLAQISDAFGNSLPGVAVKWEVQGGGVTLVNTVSTSDLSGRVSTQVKLGSTPGSATIKLSVGTISTTFSATTNVQIGGIAVVSGNNQIAIQGQAFGQPLVVRVTDSGGSPIASFPVTFVVTSGTATLSSGTASTDLTGQAQISVTAGQSAGNVVVTAAAGAGAVATFSLTVRLPGPSVSASNFKNGISGAVGVAPCAVGSVTGTGLAPGTQGLVVASQYGVGPLPLTLAGTSLSFGGLAAPIYAVSVTAQGEQINFQVPCELAPGSVNVTISTAGGGSSTINGVAVAAFSPGIFEYTPAETGTRQAVLLHQDGSFVTPSSPATRGEVIRLIATGLGGTTPALATNRTGVPGQTVTAPLVVGVNNGGVEVTNAEYMAGIVGVYTVSFRIPSDSQPGNLPLALGVQQQDGTIVYGNPSIIPVQ